MSSYPPPYNPNDPYGRQAWKTQRRMMQAQQKAVADQQRMQGKLQRAQMRAQARAARRGSLVGPILIVTLGLIFLLTQTGHLAWPHVLDWYARWWPGVLIAAGILLIAEWTLARERQNAGQPFSRPILGGGIVFLLILLALVGLGVRHLDDAHNGWNNHFFGPGWADMSPGWADMIGETHDSDGSVASPILSGQGLIIRNAHGDVTVTGSSTDNQVHVAVHKEVHAWKDSEASDREQQLQPVFASDGGQLTLTVPAVDGSTADLTIEVPHGAAVMVESGHGDVTVSELHAPLTMTARHGDVNLSAIDGSVNVHMTNDDSSVTGHSLTGPVTVQGRSGDINFSDLTGGVTLQGDFFGTTHLEHINGIVRFQTTRTKFEAARLDGEFEVDTGSELQADQLLGPVTLSTTNHNITLDRVSGQLDISNTNGSVNVTSAPPLAGITIVNKHGSVDVGLPEGAGFTLNAQTHHGDLENDFGLSHSGTDDQPRLSGSIAGGGPAVSITTSDGDITVRKSSVAPLPPAPPSPPKVTTGQRIEAPEKPEAPGPPETPEAHKATKAHKTPSAPPPPSSSNTF
jgi:DUF4097 and DUF4098 domain-containing protein YvlB